MTRIAVTGMGILSAAGRGLAETEAALANGRSGIGPLTRFPSPRCGHFPVAEVQGESSTPRTLALARDAAQQSLDSASLTPERLSSTGLAMGTCVAGMPETETAVATILKRTSAADRTSEDAVEEGVWGHHECGYLGHALAAEFGLGGPVTTLSTACSSSAQAIATAADILQAGLADVMVAGGADALCRLTLNGFASLLNVSPEGCRPFDADRDGMSLGEGAAFLVLEREPDVEAGRTVFAILRGHGNTCDAHHATAPHPEGRGAEAAMAAALAMAGIDRTAVDYVNAHGTGTVENDSAEGRALQRLFDGDAPPVSSTKRVFGHTLGAAGAIEAVASILCMRSAFVPGSLGLEKPDPRCEIRPIRETREHAMRVVLSNSFGFGGNNSSLCFAEGSDR